MFPEITVTLPNGIVKNGKCRSMNIFATRDNRRFKLKRKIGGVEKSGKCFFFFFFYFNVPVNVHHFKLKNCPVDASENCVHTRNSRCVHVLEKQHELLDAPVVSRTRALSRKKEKKGGKEIERRCSCNDMGSVCTYKSNGAGFFLCAAFSTRRYQAGFWSRSE